MTLRTVLGAVRSERGYTMVELLLVTVILGTVLSALTALFVQASKAQVDMNRRFEAQQAARIAVDTMRREIHCAKMISPTGSSTSITVTVAKQCPTAVGGVDTNHTYDVVPAGGRFQLRRNGVMLADHISEQNAFSYAAPVADTSLGKLRVTLPVNTEPGNGAKEWRLVADIVLRNTSR